MNIGKIIHIHKINIITKIIIIGSICHSEIPLINNHINNIINFSLLNFVYAV